MTKRTMTVIAYLIWAGSLVPFALFMQWLEIVSWTWLGFLSAYLFLAVSSLAIGRFEHWLTGRLQRRAERRNVASPSEH
jgi:hypothetical protein